MHAPNDQVRQVGDIELHAGKLASIADGVATASDRLAGVLDRLRGPQGASGGKQAAPSDQHPIGIIPQLGFETRKIDGNLSVLFKQLDELSKLI